MELKKFAWLLSVMVVIGLVWCRPHRILVDTDVDTDDFFALFYLLKLNKSEFDLQAVTINANAWSNAGAAVNHVYDILYMMNRDDVSVGVGGEGGILDDGTIAPNVGGYLPLIEQGNSTAGNWRYRQAILLGSGGRLDVDTSFGIRRAILPQGTRKYYPLRQPTAQKVLIQKVSEGPINLLLLGAHTNIAIFLMCNPHLKKNIEHLYIMGGGVRSNSPSGCHPKNGSSSCTPGSGYPGNLFTAYTSNPYSEFNFFGDPFAAYQVIHSGIPITLVPLDATTTIPINHNFFEAFEMNQHTYEAQYCFKSLEMARDTWSDDQFFQSYLLYDSFTAGIAVSSMRHSNNNDTGENDFALLEYMNITVITSNEPYGISDGSNPFFDNKVPKFNLMRNGVHSGHVQTGLQDPFCRGQNGPGICKDGYAEETTGPESVSIRVATKAKPNSDVKSKLDREFFKNFLEVLNTAQNSGRFNFTTQFAHYTEVLYKPDFGNRTLGRPIVFDMDMSAGDFLALFYLLKVPVEELNLKAILVSPTGWANAATIDVVYDLLHMMGRDDIPVGLGDVYAMNQSDPIFLGAGDCKYSKSIPNGGGGFLDSDTLYGLARDLPRGPRRYTAENSAKFGAPGDTKHPELRQPSALEVWDMVLEKLDAGSNITILTNGPLTSLASIVLSEKNSTSSIQDVYIVGGHIGNNQSEKGNIFTIPSNEYAEFNIFLDPLAAKTVFESGLEIKLIPLSIQRRVSAFAHLLEKLRLTKKTPEALFSQRLLSRLFRLQQAHHRYKHMETFVGEILGAVILASDVSDLSASFTNMPIKVSTTGEETEDGQLSIDKKQGKLVKVLEDVDVMAYYNLFTDRLGNMQQTAVMGSFDEQRRRWSSPPNTTGYEKSNRLKS